MIVKEIDLFKDINFEVMEEIANICFEEDYAKDTVLFEKGDEAEWLYILEEGGVNLIIKNGGSLVYRLTEAGEVFGWSSMFEPGIYTTSCSCVADTKVVKIKSKRLYDLFKLHPDEGFTILRRIGNVFFKRLSSAYRDLLTARKGDTTTHSYG